jgi:hypothetical protein
LHSDSLSGSAESPVVSESDTEILSVVPDDSSSERKGHRRGSLSGSLPGDPFLEGTGEMIASVGAFSMIA